MKFLWLPRSFGGAFCWVRSNLRELTAFLYNLWLSPHLRFSCRSYHLFSLVVDNWRFNGFFTERKTLVELIVRLLRFRFLMYWYFSLTTSFIRSKVRSYLLRRNRLLGWRPIAILHLSELINLFCLTLRSAKFSIMLWSWHFITCNSVNSLNHFSYLLNIIMISLPPTHCVHGHQITCWELCELSLI